MVGVTENLPLIICQEGKSVFMAPVVIGKQRYLSSPAGRIHNILRNGISGSESPETADDLQSLADGGTEMA
jgi:hypothetical protein